MATKRANVPKQYQTNISSWLESLTKTTYQFKSSPIIMRNLDGRRIWCIGDLHADPRGFTAALRISKLIDNDGNWCGNDALCILCGDVLDGLSRMDNNPTITEYDELFCLRIIFTLKEQAQKQGGDLIWITGNHDIMAVLGDDNYLDPTQKKGYGSKGRQYWYKAGSGILSHYMSKICVVVGIYDTLLLSHAGITQHHIDIPIIEYTNALRLFLDRGMVSSVFSKVYNSKSMMIHREYDIQPGKVIPSDFVKFFPMINKKYDVTTQIIGHNFRSSIQCISIKHHRLFLIDTGISRSFGPNSKVQTLCFLGGTSKYYAYTAV